MQMSAICSKNKGKNDDFTHFSEEYWVTFTHFSGEY